MKRELERRSYPATLRADAASGTAAGAGRIVGYAALYDSLSEPLNDSRSGATFYEKIAPGTFKRALERKPDVRLLVNHEPSLLLARTKSGTLRLSEDARGLAIDADPPDTQTARDVLTLMRRGDLDQMSFAFYTLRDDWTEREVNGSKVPLRTLYDITIDDCSIVTYPAYAATTVKARSRGMHVSVAKRIIDLLNLSRR